ncbi:hypothetical protein D0Y65_009086 [Glycine soja]|uniref:Uncharacterized protein n=1 Tax=Glycine soja TaxID=3848 RepID=A0A445KX83_GLYSO|nr:hypothetical protein D0Y65_009086 [Glycine soja]
MEMLIKGITRRRGSVSTPETGQGNGNHVPYICICTSFNPLSQPMPWPCSLRQAPPLHSHSTTPQVELATFFSFLSFLTVQPTLYLPHRFFVLLMKVGAEAGIVCEPCNGTGWLVCDFCNGQKTNVKAENNKRIYRRCPSCKAVGYVLCSKCKVFKCVTFPNFNDSEN